MENIEHHVSNIQNNGFTVIKNGINIDLVDKVVSDFDSWSALEENKFKRFNKERVTNFHIYNENTKNLVTNTHVNEILETLFKKPQVIYSSLFFREGTAQHFHIDTPHFYTNPIDNYYGVWYALEDIDINAGPLKYYVGSNKLESFSGYECYNKFLENEPNYTIRNNDFRMLIEYNKQIEDLCKENNLERVDEKNYINKINKGDVIIWHPKLLHGGSDIIDPTLTRYSMVTHNVPINTQVFSARHFFAPSPTSGYLENKFTHKYITHNNVNIIDHGIGPSVQKSYV